MHFVGVPLHAIHLDSDLVKGRVVVGVRSQFPIEGVSFILGNDLAGGKVLVNPEVCSVCAVTRAMSERQKQELSDGEGVG